MSRQRTAELARIHILKKELQLDDDTYRRILMLRGKVESAADLDVYGRNQVISHLVTLKGKSKRKWLPQDKKIMALWHQLGRIGAVENTKLPALLAYVKRQTGCERLEWLDGHQASHVIESLKAWLRRVEGENG